MVLGGLVMLLMNIRPGAAEMPGKVATAAFYGIMILIIGFGPEVGAFRSFFTLPEALTGVLVVVSAILTLIAFASYMPETYRQFKEHFSEKKVKKSSK